MRILNPSEIHQPKNPAVIDEKNDKDWELELGGVDEVLVADKNWVPFLTEFELQRNENFDAYDCVTQGIINAVQAIIKKKYAKNEDFSKRYLAVLSGTVPGRGNSIRQVAETLRTLGTVLEKDYVTMTPEMTETEFYKQLTDDLKAKEYFLKNYTYNHKNLPTSFLGATMESIIENGLGISPVTVAIEGRYSFDDQGRLEFAGGAPAHVVDVVTTKPDCFLVIDSENPQGLMKVRRDYNFVSPKISFVEKKTMFKLIKEEGSPAVYLQVPSQNLYAISDGDEVPGGDLLKSFSGSYGNAGITRVPAGTLDKSKIVGKVAARKDNLISSIFNI